MGTGYLLSLQPHMKFVLCF